MKAHDLSVLGPEAQRASSRFPEEPITRVIFRIDRETGDPIAIFPDIPHDAGGRYLTCYQHIGQHGACAWGAMLEQTRPVPVPGPQGFTAQEETDYRAAMRLARELESAPYWYRLTWRARNVTRRRKGGE